MGVALVGVVSVGVLTPHASPGPEIEFAEMAGEQVVTRLVRIPAQGATREDPGTPPTTPAGLREIAVASVLNQAAAEAMGGGQVEAIGYASTTSGYATGFDAETTLLRHVSHEWGVPVAGTSSSAVDALRAFDVQRLTLVHPRGSMRNSMSSVPPTSKTRASRSWDRHRPTFRTTRASSGPAL